MTDDPNVNLNRNVSTEVNIKRLGGQQKDILRWLYENREGAVKQVEIIEAIYDEVTDSRKASVSRSVSKLEQKNLIEQRKKVLITPDDNPMVSEPYYSRHRVRFFITETGERFVEADDRFPNITGGGA